MHSKELFETIKLNNFYEPDCPNYKNIFYYSLLSAGGAIKAMEIALKKEFSFSLMRPPGHHAGKNSLGGFCYFNNIAIAVVKALEKLNKIAIIGRAVERIPAGFQPVE